MFYYASSFEADLCSWDLGSAQNVLLAFVASLKQTFCDCTAQPGYHCVQGLTDKTGTGCSAGQYCTGQRSPARPCTEEVPAGSYCPALTASATGSPCPKGSYCSGGNKPAVACEPGTFQNEPGKPECKPCSEGTFSWHAGSATQDTCQTCSPGSYTDEKGQSECTPCGAG
eukprot:910838-Rhodomonas_salina.1